MRTPKHVRGTVAPAARVAERRGSRRGTAGRTTLVLVWLAASALAAGAPTFAEDFTVTVPIQIKTMPVAYTRGMVQCSADPPAGSGYTIGMHQFFFDIVGGNYTNTAVIKFNADPGRDPGQATSIGCGLWLSTASGNTWVHPSMIGDGTVIDRTQPFKESSSVQIPTP